jgi:hypothetical protein
MIFRFLGRTCACDALTLGSLTYNCTESLRMRLIDYHVKLLVEEYLLYIRDQPTYAFDFAEDLS